MSELPKGEAAPKAGAKPGADAKPARGLSFRWLRPFVAIVLAVALALGGYFLLYANQRVDDRVRLIYRELDWLRADLETELASHLDSLAHATSAPAKALARGVAGREVARQFFATTQFTKVSQAPKKTCKDDDPALVIADGRFRATRSCLAGEGPLESLIEWQPGAELVDGVVLARADGTIVRRAPRVPSLVQLDLPDRKPPLEPGDAKAAEKSNSSAPFPAAGALPNLDPLGIAKMPPVDAGGVQYRVLCVPFSPPVPKSTELLKLCGLVQESGLRAHAVALSPIASAWLAAFVAAVFLALPYLKVRFLGRHERLRARDMWLLAASLPLIAGAGTVLLLQVYAVGRMRGFVDAELVGSLDRARTRFDAEIDAAYAQLTEAAPRLAQRKPKTNQGSVLLKERFSYPLFEALVLTKGDEQTRKWMPRVRATELHSFAKYKWYKQAAELSSAEGGEFVFDQTIAKTSSLSLAVLAVAIDAGQTPLAIGSHVPVTNRTGIAVLATPLLSVQNSAIPYPYRVIVVDRNGEILFRSDGSSTHRDPFADGWEDAPQILALAGSAAPSVPSDHRHQGRMYRVSAVRAEQSGVTLVAFYEKGEMERVAAQSVKAPLFLLLVLTAGMLACALAARLIRPQVFDWVWPTKRRTHVYAAAVVALCGVGAGMAVVALAAPAGLVPYVVLGVPWLCSVGLCLASTSAPGRRLVAKLPVWPPVGERSYPISFVAFGVAGLVALVVVPLLLTGGDAIQAHEQALRIKQQQESQARLRVWDERMRKAVAPVPDGGPKPGELDRLEGTRVPVPADYASEYLRHAAALGNQIPRETGGAANSEHFSVPLAAGWAELSRTRLALPAELALAARGSGTSVETTKGAALAPVFAGSVGLVGLLCCLVYSIGHRILGMALEGDGVVDRSSELERRGGPFLLLRPSQEQLDKARGLLGTAEPPIDLRNPKLRPEGLPAEGPLLLLHAERVLHDPAWREALRGLLSTHRKAVVAISSEIDPLHYLLSRMRSLGGAEGEALRREVADWAAALSDSRRIRFQLETTSGGPPTSDVAARLHTECECSDYLRALEHDLRDLAERDRLDWSDTLELVMDAAEPHYRMLWELCSIEERLVLRQLADEGLVSPRCSDVLQRLRRRRLVRVDPRFRLVNESFLAFVTCAESEETIERWEHPEGERGSVRVSGPLLAFGGALTLVLLAAVQGRDSLAFISAAAVSVPALWRSLVAASGRGGPTLPSVG